MSLLDELIRKAGPAGPRLRVALIAECAERAYPVYLDTWEGQDPPSIPRAFAIGWDFALGKPVDPAEVRACLAEIDSYVDFYLDEGNDLPGGYCVLAKRVLECLSPVEADAYKAFGRGLMSYQDVANLAESLANKSHRDQPPRKLASAQVGDWEDKALALIAAWQGDPVRDMFAALGPVPPEWIADWKARKPNT
jgi:hypothetical protein